MSLLPIKTPQTVWPGSIYDAEALVEATPTQRPGASIQITASVAGTVTLTLWSGAELIVTVPLGDSIYPYQVTKATQGTATVTRYYNLFK